MIGSRVWDTQTTSRAASITATSRLSRVCGRGRTETKTAGRKETLGQTGEIPGPAARPFRRTDSES